MTFERHNYVLPDSTRGADSHITAMTFPKRDDGDDNKGGTTWWFRVQADVSATIFIPRCSEWPWIVTSDSKGENRTEAHVGELARPGLEMVPVSSKYVSVARAFYGHSK